MRKIINHDIYIYYVFNIKKQTGRNKQDYRHWSFLFLMSQQAPAEVPQEQTQQPLRGEMRGRREGRGPVSYTHLTLPTN